MLGDLRGPGDHARRGRQLDRVVGHRDVVEAGRSDHAAVEPGADPHRGEGHAGHGGRRDADGGAGCGGDRGGDEPAGLSGGGRPGGRGGGAVALRGRGGTARRATGRLLLGGGLVRRALGGRLLRRRGLLGGRGLLARRRLRVRGGLARSDDLLDAVPASRSRRCRRSGCRAGPSVALPSSRVPGDTVDRAHGGGVANLGGRVGADVVVAVAPEHRPAGHRADGEHRHADGGDADPPAGSSGRVAMRRPTGGVRRGGPGRAFARAGGDERQAGEGQGVVRRERLDPEQRIVEVVGPVGPAGTGVTGGIGGSGIGASATGDGVIGGRSRRAVAGPTPAGRSARASATSKAVSHRGHSVRTIVSGMSPPRPQAGQRTPSNATSQGGRVGWSFAARGASVIGPPLIASEIECGPPCGRQSQAHQPTTPAVRAKGRGGSGRRRQGG